ncbi:TetR/AcrR family transcriptional regulator [Nocardioides sp. zg-536]|uniref:TetR/AcrR family transcriptional regulator n=1 Tax=Nocardioides faecalis TaxID=2803858 RepID=A0A938Y6Y3_9ACTN|nr:TetR/AcrR family transcriptional regulator [Nocardioides faecalis]MBM9458344.1 TetR/AcrR family transcriptional regulator [Nocardioides faecalis]MBS4753355.1 TetR/AcrR family transcriptional regulator [Nocardioides faecalis]QVI58369.1 TetR/AcrR family transcriptional regulator [Nocardioides faecalis]
MDPNERRRLILDRSAEIFARKGVSATTIREIGQAVGVHSGALYHYFPSKEAIVTELVREYVTDLAGRCRAVVAKQLPPLERMRAFTEIVLATNVDYPGATAVWRREGDYMRERVVEADLTELADTMTHAWQEAIRDGVASGELRADIDPRIFHELIYDALWHTERWFTPGEQHTVRELAAIVTSVFVDGMRARD